MPQLTAEGLRVVRLLDHLKDRRVFGDGVDERVYVRVPEPLADTNVVGHRELVLSGHDEDVVLVEQILQRTEFDVTGLGQADAVDSRAERRSERRDGPVVHCVSPPGPTARCKAQTA